MSAKNTIISHTVNPQALTDAIEKIKTRIIKAGDKEYVTVKKQLELLYQLSQFDLGKFLIQNGGVDGYWTHYFLMHPKHGRITGKNNRGEVFSDLEKTLLDRLPLMLATQERFEIFLKENQKSVKESAKLACIPCGLLGELLYLDYQNIADVELVGIDLDSSAMDQAKSLAKERNLADKIKLIQEDAWRLNIENEFNLISSNGLNIYESDPDRIFELYSGFYQALAPNGKLVTSFLTYPAIFHDKTEWHIDCINQEMLFLQKIIFIDILNAKFSCFMTTKEMTQMLEKIGFKNIQILPDKANMFPTVVAYKNM